MFQTAFRSQRDNAGFETFQGPIDAFVLHYLSGHDLNTVTFNTVMLMIVITIGNKLALLVSGSRL